MSIRGSHAALAFLALLAAVGGGRAEATPEVLASADFESDAVGSSAKPGLPFEVSEDLWDQSTWMGGTSEVVAAGSHRRYRLCDVGAPGQVKKVRLNLASTVSSGALTVSGILTAEQTDADGGVLAASDPGDGKEWGCRVAFGADGKFNVHGSATEVAYEADTSYAVTMTVHFGLVPTADYTITDAGTAEILFSSTGWIVADCTSAGSVTFSTDAQDAGGFTVDEILATAE